MNKFRTLVIISTISIVLFIIYSYLLLVSTFSIGGIINRYIPCKQDALDFVTCYSVWDEVFLFIFFVILIASSVVVIIEIFKKGEKVLLKIFLFILYNIVVIVVLLGCLYLFDQAALNIKKERYEYEMLNKKNTKELENYESNPDPWRVDF